MPKVSVFVEREQVTKELEVASLEEVFKKLKINPDTVIIVINKKLVTSKAEIHDGDAIELLSVISGG